MSACAPRPSEPARYRPASSSRWSRRRRSGHPETNSAERIGRWFGTGALSHRPCQSASGTGSEKYPALLRTRRRPRQATRPASIRRPLAKRGPGRRASRSVEEPDPRCRIESIHRRVLPIVSRGPGSCMAPAVPACPQRYRHVQTTSAVSRSGCPSTRRASHSEIRRRLRWGRPCPLLPRRASARR